MGCLAGLFSLPEQCRIFQDRAWGVAEGLLMAGILWKVPQKEGSQGEDKICEEGGLEGSGAQFQGIQG